jgi:DNA-binding MarR family transcriptional regulator
VITLTAPKSVIIPSEAPASTRRVTKQAMAEIVDDLVERQYLVRAPDPSDRRAKLILWGARGLSAHQATMNIFSELEEELAVEIGKDVAKRLRSAASIAASAVTGEKAK